MCAIAFGSTAFALLPLSMLASSLNKKFGKANNTMLNANSDSVSKVSFDRKCIANRLPLEEEEEEEEEEEDGSRPPFEDSAAADDDDDDDGCLGEKSLPLIFASLALPPSTLYATLI